MSHNPAFERAARHVDPTRGHIARVLAFSSLATREAPVETDPESPAAEQVFWEGPIGFENELTGDGRLIEQNALEWDHSPENPGVIRYVSSDIGAHHGAVVVGHIYGVERRAGGEIWAWGDFDLRSEHGIEAKRQVQEKLTNGVSMDLDDTTFEVRVAAEIIAKQDEMMQALIDENGEMPEIERETDDEGRVIVGKMSPEDEIVVMTSARVRSATIVAIPAFIGAKIALRDAPESAPGLTSQPVDALVASAAGTVTAPPSDWFANPYLREATPIEVTADGRVFGHLATWNVCHIASPGGEGVCIVAPHSPTDYSMFHTGAVLTADDKTVATGRITMNTGHAGLRASAANAMAHYDNTGFAVADIRVGEDSHGIWVAGAVRPGATPEQIHALRGSPLSGDWRPSGAGHELVAALAVNTPGFPIPRPSGLVASGQLQALVASGMITPSPTQYEIPSGLTEEDVVRLRELAQRDRKAEADRLRERVFAKLSADNKRHIDAFVARQKGFGK